MEIGIAVYALLVPLLFSWIDNVYALIWQQFQPGFFVFSLWRFVLSGLVLLAPTTLMGATLPVLAAALVYSSGKNSVTRLYACNLAGAILGTLAAGFVLLPTLGVRTTIAVAAVMNIVVGAIAILLQRRTNTAAPAAEEISGGPTLEVGNSGFWIFAALISGFVTISTQVSWTRVLTMIIGSSTYAFSIVVALFLIGLAAGAWFVARVAQSDKLRPMILKVEALTAISLVLSLFVLNKLPAWLIYLGLRFQISSWAGLLALHHIVDEPVLGLLVAGLAALALGFVTSFLVMRGAADLTRLMVTLGIALLLRELADRFSNITGGFDGLQGIVMQPVLGQFEYSRNETVLHTDSSLLPATKNARACWNYVVRDDAPLTTYWMNRLQGLETEETYLVTLNGAEAVDPTKVIARMEYEHPIYTPKAVAAQSRLAELNTGRIAFAGAYHGWGFHEDGCRAGVAAAESFGVRW